MVSAESSDHHSDCEVITATTAHENAGSTWSDVVLDGENVEISEKTSLLPRSHHPQRRPQGKYYIPKRYELVFMIFIGGGFLYGNRINISVTIPAMTNATFTSVHHEGASNQTVETCPTPNTTDESSFAGEFLWTAREQELVIASFFYGYSVTQIPAGWLTDKIGGTRLYGLGLFISAAGSLMAPSIAKLGPTYFVVLRLLCGIFEGGSLPAIGSMLSRWYPGTRNGLAFIIAISGSKFGTFFGTIISGLLSSTNFLGGWPSTYYFFGTLTIIWAFTWAILIYEQPHLHPRVSREEFEYLSSAAVITEKTAKVTIPLKSILTSIPVWAIIICSFVGTWSNNTIFTNQPIYLKHVQGMNMEMIGVLSSIPFAVEGAALVISGNIANKLMDDKILSTGATRKLLSFIGLTLCAVSFLLLANVGCNSALSVVLMICAIGFNGICTSGYYVNMMDIAPRLAGSLIGLASTASSLSAALAPYVIGVYTTTQSDIRGWQSVFFIASGLSMLAGIVFVVFGSGDVQEWAKAPEERTNHVIHTSKQNGTKL